MFLQSKRPEIRDKYPNASLQEIIRLLNEAWNIEKASGNKKLWDERAKNAEHDGSIGSAVDAVAVITPVPEMRKNNHLIKKCDICGLMIANMTAHMMNHIGEQVVTEVVPAELVEVQHAVDKHER